MIEIQPMRAKPRHSSANESGAGWPAAPAAPAAAHMRDYQADKRKNSVTFCPPCFIPLL